MSKKDGSKSRKRLTLSLALVVSLGILSIVYAIVSSQLNIKFENSKLVERKGGLVQFSNRSDDAFAFSAGSDQTVLGVFSGPFYSTSYNLSDSKSASYVFANAGTVSIGKTTNENDTATINGTKLFEKGAYVVYKLKVINTSEDFPMRLSSIDSSITATPESIKDSVKVKIFDADPNSTTSSANEVTTITEGSAKDLTASTSNYLKPTETTDWYVKIYFDKTADFEEGDFSFDVQPYWIACPKS